MDLLADLVVGSLLIYAKGSSPASLSSRMFIRYEVKQGKAGRIEHCAKRAREHYQGTALESVFRSPGVLVPIPGHAPLVKGGFWPARAIAEAFLSEGLGDSMALLLERIEEVPQSSRIHIGSNRPRPQIHYESLAIAPPLVTPLKVILVDDVVTRGSTLIAAATRVRSLLPDAEIVSFALARVEDVDLVEHREMLSPQLEVIRYDGSTIHRRQL